MIKLKDLLVEITFNDLYDKKNKWIQILKNKKELSDNFYVLINNAYKPIGGHVGIKSTGDIYNSKYNYWEAVDIDIDPLADCVIFGQKRNGIKLSGIGHDGTKAGKKMLLIQLSKVLKRGKYWIESSGPVRNVLLKYGAKYVTNKNVLQKLYPDSKFEFINDYSYIRTLENGKKTALETLFGTPKV